MRPLRPSTSSFVPTCEREELQAAFASFVYERGLAATRLADVARIAGVPPPVVTGYWADEAACLVDAVDAATGQAFSRMAEVFINSDSDCPTAAHHALATLLSDLAGAPEMVHLAVIELPQLGTSAQDQQERLLDLFCEFLVPGFVAMGHPVPSPEIVSTCLAGGLWETVRRMTLERQLHHLPHALPAISFVCISTFFGTDEATRVSQIPVRVEPREAGVG